MLEHLYLLLQFRSVFPETFFRLVGDRTQRLILDEAIGVLDRALSLSDSRPTIDSAIISYSAKSGFY